MTKAPSQKFKGVPVSRASMRENGVRHQLSSPHGASGDSKGFIRSFSASRKNNCASPVDRVTATLSPALSPHGASGITLPSEY